MTSQYWHVQFPDREPIERKYQWPVSAAQVLADHRAAVAAEPVGGARTPPTVGDIERTYQQTGIFR